MKIFFRLALSVFVFFVTMLFFLIAVSWSISSYPTVITAPDGLKPGDAWPSWLSCREDFGWYMKNGGIFCYSSWDSGRVFVSSSDGKTVSHSSILDPSITLGDLEVMWGEPELATYGQWWTEVSWSGFKMAYTESTNPESRVFLVSFDVSDRYVTGDKWRGHVRER